MEAVGGGALSWRSYRLLLPLATFFLLFLSFLFLFFLFPPLFLSRFFLFFFYNIVRWKRCCACNKTSVRGIKAAVSIYHHDGTNCSRDRKIDHEIRIPHFASLVAYVSTLLYRQADCRVSCYWFQVMHAKDCLR